jgi:hypothetical protein
MTDEQVFRFMVLRQPTDKLAKESQKRKAISYSVTGNEPPLVKQVFALPPEQRTLSAIKQLAEQFKATDRYVQDLKSLSFDVSPLLTWLEEQGSRPLKSLDLAAFVKKTYGRPPAEVIKLQPFVESADRLAETVFANVLGDNNQQRQRDDIVSAIKLLYLVSASAAQSGLLKTDEQLSALFARLLVMIPELILAAPEPTEPTIKPGTPGRGDDARTKALRQRLEQLASAHIELTSAVAHPDGLQAAGSKVTQRVATQSVAADRIDVLEAQIARISQQLDKPALAAADVPNLPEPPSAGAGLFQARPKITLANQTIEALSPETRSVLSELRIDLQSSSPFAAVTTLETQLSLVAAQLPATTTPRKVIAFGGAMLDAEVFMDIYDKWAGALDVTTMPGVQPCQFKAGIGDLLIVRQKLKAYELGDFAHVENVLKGESREREHRRLSVREEIVTSETQRETEKERNLQSTERNEMESEASKTVQSQFQLDAGLQVSGSYGPAVSFSASLNTSFSTSTEESQRKAVSYSREVTEKTVERIRELVREERRVRTLEQIEEINVHKIENTQNPKGHVRGIYRWLNKIYDAQIFNYGQRMMYEFVIPEPAAYFLYAMIENPPQDMELEKPEPPTYGGVALKPENLTRTNYQQYLAKYEVTNAKAPPASFKNVAYFEKQEGKEESHYQRSSKIAIPEGYEATSATTWWGFVRSDDHADRAELVVLTGGYDASSGWVSFSTPYRDEISVGVHTIYTKAFVVTVDIYCQLTTEGFAKWQHETFAAIMESYLNKRAAYEEKLEQLAIQKGPQILGRNPFENLRIERDELKKLVIMTLRQDSYLNINSYYGGAEPYMNISKACGNGSLIRFFENAFEWNNMTYVFYPYFWGRHARWISALHLTDPDLDFAAFLRAGAARVQVPVRPGFERAVAYFSQVGEIWEGSDVPLIGDSMYVPIVEEISENLGKLDDGVPYPADSQPWEVTVPTSLVVVQDLEEIPAIRDGLTGDPIKLVPNND